MPAKRSLPKLVLDDVLSVPKAKRAFDFLVSKNAHPHQLWILVQCAVGAYSMPHSYDMLSVDGMTRTEVSAFPNQLETVARAIELINENSMHLEVSGALKATVDELPSHLRRYAHFLSKTIESSRKFMKANPRYWDFVPIFKLKLLRYVQRVTGEPRYGAVADLLNAALTTAGFEESETSEAFVSPDSLRKLYSRNWARKEPRS